MRCKSSANYILTLDDVIASRGGIPLVESGKLIGAIGCSGGTGSQDEATCTAAANTVNK
jgi:glc operon protein GlcG